MCCDYFLVVGFELTSIAYQIIAFQTIFTELQKYTLLNSNTGLEDFLTPRPFGYDKAVYLLSRVPPTRTDS